MHACVRARACAVPEWEVHGEGPSKGDREPVPFYQRFSGAVNFTGTVAFRGAAAGDTRGQRKQDLVMVVGGPRPPLPLRILLGNHLPRVAIWHFVGGTEKLNFKFNFILITQIEKRIPSSLIGKCVNYLIENV